MTIFNSQFGGFLQSGIVDLFYFYIFARKDTER